MLWLIISVAGYFLNSIAVLVDKHLLKRDLPHPVVYAFYSSALGMVVLLALPFASALPTLPILLISLGAGGLFTAALYVFYTLLQQGEASRVTPVVGGLSPLFTLALAWVLLGEALTKLHGIAFALILLGSWLVSREKGSGTFSSFEQKRYLTPFLAAFLFAASHVLTKLVYVEYDFIGGLVWRTIGAGLAAAALLLIKKDRTLIIETFKMQKRGTDALFVAGQVCGSASFIVVNYAFSIGSIALVNALSGTQYIFVFLIAIVLTRWFPGTIREEISARVIIHKSASLLLIGAGIALLFT